MKNEQFSHLKPRGINILNEESVILSTPKSINEQMIDNNQSDIIVKYKTIKLTPKIIELVTNELSWLDEDTDLWALNVGDTDIKIVNAATSNSSQNIVETLLLARTIFIIDNEEPLDCYNANEIKKRLLDYQEAIRKGIIDNCFEKESLEDLKLSEEDQEIKDYEDDLFTAVTKRTYQLPDKCFNIFMIDFKEEKITKIL